VFVLSLAAPLAQAQTDPAAGATPPAASPVDPASIQALKDMGAYLQSLQRFRVRTDLTGERVPADGQKLQYGRRLGHRQHAVLDEPRVDHRHAERRRRRDPRGRWARRTSFSSA
jgi:hypothetical protein